MNLTEMYNGYAEIDLTDEEREFIRFMVDNAYWPGASSISDVMYIVFEEAGAVWVGDKTAEEAADIIQSRVSVYISEQSG